MKPFTEIKVADYELAKVQSAISTAVNPVLTLPINDGRLVQDVNLVSGINLIPTGLGRLPQFWFVARKNSTGDIWETVSQTTTALLALNASAPMQVSLWVG